MAEIETSASTEPNQAEPPIVKLDSGPGFTTCDVSKNASIDDLDHLVIKIGGKYPILPMPTGLGRRRKPQKAPCTQWPWAGKNKSSILFEPPTSSGDNLGGSGGASESSMKANNLVKYPWSHQHRSEALDFVRSSPDPGTDDVKKSPQSLYKSDFASPNSLLDCQKPFGRASNKSSLSLNGTNIRGNTNVCMDDDWHRRQRWTSKVIEKKGLKPRRGIHPVERERQEELDRISKLNVEQAYEKLLREKEEGTIKDGHKRSPLF